MADSAHLQANEQPLQVPAGRVTLHGDLGVPAGASSIVVFAHGSGSSRHSPRNRFVARTMQQMGLATLLFDLLTAEEEAIDDHTAELSFDIALLAERLALVTDWLVRMQRSAWQRIGYFGASTGAAAALVAAAERAAPIGAVVSRSGRPDLAGVALTRVRAPTLLIVGGADPQVLDLNRQALARMVCERQLEVVPGATHLFEEPGTLARVAELASAWFSRHLVHDHQT
jgi:dienelactone hydrolase